MSFCNKLFTPTGPTKIVDYDSLEPSESASLVESRECSKIYTNVYGSENVGLIMAYFNVGIALTLFQTPIAYYMIKELNVSSRNYSASQILINTPWALKFIVGLISDTYPIKGYYRKPYIIYGWISYFCCCLLGSSLSTPTFSQLCIVQFFMVLSYIVADVVCDAAVVERSRYEDKDFVGNFQTHAFIYRSIGSTLGAILGTILYNEADW
jgi:MFS family permease